MKQSYVVVPARGGSKGIPNKNSEKVFGRTLTVRALVHARYLVPDANIILSTDSEKIVREVVEFFGIDSYNLRINSLCRLGPFWIHFRDKSLSSDATIISEVLLAIRDLLVNIDKPINVICLLQPTTPFRSFNELKKIKAIIFLKGNPDFSLVSVSKVDNFHPARMYFMNKNKMLKPLLGFAKYRYDRRQDLPEIFIRDGGFYIIGDKLVSSGIQYANQPMSYIREFPWTINIDTVKDLILAQSVNRFEIKDDPNEL